MCYLNRKPIYLNDSIHGLIQLSEYEKRIISSTGFNRLHDVYQNSTVYLTYPTNRTKRFEHSIGTMKICSNMFYYSVLNASEEVLNEFYEIYVKAYESIIKNEISNEICEYKLGEKTPRELKEITPSETDSEKLDSFLCSLIPYNVQDKYTYIHLLLIQSIRVAALLHDIGHPPYSHVVERAMESVYNEEKGNMNESNPIRTDFLHKMSSYVEEGKPLHEQMGNKISSDILKRVIKKIDARSTSMYRRNLCEILIAISVDKIFNEKPPFSFLHRLIDSSLDGDRLDYVTRDSLNSGLRSGEIDYSRILSDMKLIIADDPDELDVSKKERHPYFCVPMKAMNAVEDFLKRRYNIYKGIINHHRVIKTDYLLEYTVRDLIRAYLDNPTVRSASINEKCIPFHIGGLWFPLKSGTTGEMSNALAQWNDSWLMTVLKQIFYEHYFEGDDVNNPGGEKFILSRRLYELLCNEKSYYSLVKRSEDFRVLDDSIKNELGNLKPTIEQWITGLKSVESHNQPLNNGFFRVIENLIEDKIHEEASFVLPYIFEQHKSFYPKSDTISNLIRECAKEAIYQYPGLEIRDVIVETKRIKTGLKNPIYFYNDNDEIHLLQSISGIESILLRESNYNPMCYIYLLSERGDINQEQKKEILCNIGKKFAMKFVDVLQKLQH